MNKDQMQGKMQNLKGKIKDAAGGATDNHSLEAEGKADRAAGAARGKLGDAKESVKNPRNKH